MRTSFLLHIDSLLILDKMSNEQAGVLLKAMYYYQINGTLPELDFAIEMAVTPFINQFKRDSEKYIQVVEKRKEAGAKGGKQKLANASKCKQSVAKLADSVNDSVSKNNKKDILMSDFDTTGSSDEFSTAYTIAESFRKKFIQIIDSKGGSLEELKVAKVEAWVSPIILLQKKDKVSIDKIREVYKEFGNLDFWPGVISSTSGIRKNFNKLVMAVDKLKPNQKVVSSEMTDAERNKLLRQQMGI